MDDVVDRSDEETDSENENDTDNEDFDKDQLLLVHIPYLKYFFSFKYACALNYSLYILLSNAG